jgi:hypothetical protein
MRFGAGRALRGTYVEDGGTAAARSVLFVADPTGRFALWCQETGDEARCDGRTVWSVEDGVATFVAPVPPGDRGPFGLVAAPIAELLDPESAYIEAALADPDTRDEELDMGQVRISGNESSIVYDRSIDIIHEYRRPDGLERRLTGLGVVEASRSAFRWDGPVARPLTSSARVTTAAPLGSLDELGADAAFAAHVEHRTSVLSYWLDGPGASTGGAGVDECVAWALERAERVPIAVDLVSGETRHFVAGDPKAPADERWESVRDAADRA